VIRVMGKIQLTHDAKAETLTLEWDADAENDMWADSILATVLHIGSSPATVKLADKCPVLSSPPPPPTTAVLRTFLSGRNQPWLKP
jgi:hypothetical protein